MPRKAMPVVERFMAFVDDTGACWEWRGYRHPTGYGYFGYGRRADGHMRNARAHRVSYELFVGPIPEGLSIDHLCDNPGCVNPEHLRAVTITVNQSRQRRPNREKTHCKRNHELNEANTYVRANGSRRCRVCHREARAAA